MFDIFIHMYYIRVSQTKGGETMSVQRITLDIDKELWRKVGILAATEGTTRREIVTKALKLLLNEK